MHILDFTTANQPRTNREGMRNVSDITRQLLRTEYVKIWQQMELYKTYNQQDVACISRMSKEIKLLKINNNGKM